MGARILLIEDNRENLDLMTYLLRAYGHTVLIAEDGAEGLELAQRELPDLVLTDLHMPKTDGFEVAEAIRKDESLRRRPVVAVTSYAMRGDRERVLAHGFDGYISKPIVPEEFVAQIERFLDAGKHCDAPIAQHSSQEPQEPRTYHAVVLVVDNSRANLILAESTLEPFGYKVIGASDVQTALKIARQIRPDLILSDLHMPDRDGFDFCNAVKDDAMLRDIPFAIISSTFWPQDDLVRALQIGVKRFIQRPVDPGRLVAEIEACLADSRQAAREEAHGENTGS
jgi:two-component system cell cycle response regulator